MRFVFSLSCAFFMKYVCERMYGFVCAYYTEFDCVFAISRAPFVVFGRTKSAGVAAAL